MSAIVSCHIRSACAGDATPVFRPSSISYGTISRHRDAVLREPHDCGTHSQAQSHKFPQLSRGVACCRRASCRAGRTERRGQDQSDRGDLFLRPGPWPAPRHARRSRILRGRRLMGGRRRNRRCARPRNAWDRESSRNLPTPTSPLRKCRIDGEPAPSAAAFTDHVSVVWLTPAMDGLFAGPASERRRFLDRLVLAVDGTHSSRVNALERSLRSRNRLLEQPNADRALARCDRTRNRRGGRRGRRRTRRNGAAACRRARRAIAIRRRPSRAAGDRARWLDRERVAGPLPAAEVEDRYRAVLRDEPRARCRRRAHDSTARISPISTVAVRAERTSPAAARLDRRAEGAADRARARACRAGRRDDRASRRCCCSTRWWRISTPAAARRSTTRSSTLGAQVWMTGADPAPFAAVASRAQTFEVSPGRVTPAQ